MHRKPFPACGGRSCIPQENGAPRRTVSGRYGERPSVRRGFLLKSEILKLYRILRQRDCPTAHPRHGEYSSRLRLHKRHDTDGRRRQLTKLPKPCPQYPPFTLRYGYMLVLPASQLMAIPALPAPGYRPFGLPLVLLILSV